MLELESLLKPTQDELFKMMCEKYHGNALYMKESFVLVKGTAPILLVAHLDTVHKEAVREICTSVDGNILMSPQGIGGDDRCGCYVLVKAYEQTKIKPFLLFTCEEETGGEGAEKFCVAYSQKKLPVELNRLKCIVEVDRRGSKDAVYYDCCNDDFERYITGKGFRTSWGTFSDISIIAPVLKVAAVNLSAGYYAAHTLHEYINRTELNRTLAKVIEIVEETTSPKFPRYEYVENYCSLLTNYYDDDFEMFMMRVPEEYREMYTDLLNYYTLDELAYYREIYGDKKLEELYISDFDVQ